jgi:hypothetical protein
MYKKIACAVIVKLGCLSVACADQWQFQLGLGKGLNKALIQQYGIANAEVASVGVHIPIAWATAFDWAAVDQTYFKLQHAHLWGEGAEHREQLSVSEAGLVFRWQANGASEWFYETGIGLSHLSDRRYQAIETHGQNNFALDFALGHCLPWASQWELSLRYRHYSNGYTHRPNPGLDYAALVLAHRF